MRKHYQSSDVRSKELGLLPNPKKCIDAGGIILAGSVVNMQTNAVVAWLQGDGNIDDKAGLHSVESHELTYLESMKASERDFHLHRWATGP